MQVGNHGRIVFCASFTWLILCGAELSSKQVVAGESPKANALPQPVPTTIAGPTNTPGPTFTPYPNYNPDPCYRVREKDVADLCAQWRSAIATEKAVHEARRANTFGLIAAIVGVITILGLLVTILFTHRALAEARRANRINLLTERAARREAKEAAAEQARALKLAEGNARAARKQARISQRNLNDTRKARIEDRRPWVALRAEPDSPFWFDGVNARTTIQLQMTNLGRTIARDVIAWADMYVGGGIDQRDASLTRVKEWVSRRTNSTQFHRRIILPGQTTYFEPNLQCTWAEEDLYRIIAYVEYIFEGSKERHYTWELFDMSRDRENKRVIRYAEGTVPKDQLSIFPTGVGDAK